MSNGHGPFLGGKEGINPLLQVLHQLNRLRLANIISSDIGMGKQPPEIIPKGKTSLNLADELLNDFRKKGFSPEMISRGLQAHVEGKGEFGMATEAPINPPALPDFQQRLQEHNANLPEFNPRARFEQRGGVLPTRI